jgi:hypothetical protein
MKTIRRYLIIFLLTALIINIENSTAQNASVSFQVFYDNLSPYGSWISYPDYGYVWIPSAGPDFFPYSTGGYWVYTEFGWTWISEYSWGWAPFHYGRWLYDPFYGWVWVPGDQWGPAWVVWRKSPGYYGWAPIGPGVSINVAFSPTYHPTPEYWTFANEQYIGRPDLNNYYGPRKDNTQLIKNSNPINNTREDKNRNTTYIIGPEKNEIQKASGKIIEPIAVREINKPDQSIKNNEITIYRPRINSSTDSKPVKVTDKNEIKRVSEPRDQKKETQTDRPKETIPQSPKEQLPVKKDEPQPVVPDNTRTNKPEPKVVPRTNKTMDAPKTEQQKTQPKTEERKIPVVPQEKQIETKPEMPMEPKTRQQPVPAPTPIQKPTQQNPPRHIPKQPRQGPRK